MDKKEIRRMIKNLNARKYNEVVLFLKDEKIMRVGTRDVYQITTKELIRLHNR
jgi:hypothetical protein